MASRKLLVPSVAVYQAGRGSEPMIEVGRVTPADALYIRFLSRFLVVERFAFRGGALQQRGVRLRQRCAGFAEAVDDGVAAVAAEILQRHFHPGGGLAALV